MTCLAPGVGDISSDENNRSLVLLAERWRRACGCCLPAIWGEEEEGRLLEQLSSYRTDKVGHHGSATSHRCLFAGSLSAGLAVISCGETTATVTRLFETVERPYGGRCPHL